MLSLDSILEGVITIAKADRCVVRNAAYHRGEFSIRKRHNARKNSSYDYAKEFFAETYNLAIKEVGGEDFI